MSVRPEFIRQVLGTEVATSHDSQTLIARVGAIRVRRRRKPNVSHPFRLWGPNRNQQRGDFETLDGALEFAERLAHAGAIPELYELGETV